MDAGSASHRGGSLGNVCCWSRGVISAGSEQRDQGENEIRQGCTWGLRSTESEDTELEIDSHTREEAVEGRGGGG